MEPLGAQLKAAREQKQLTIARVAGDTRISAAHIESLESGQYSRLPGGAYNRAFLRAYSDYLGLDTAALLEQYRLETAPPAEKAAKARPRAPLAESGFHVHPIFIWSLMLVASIAGLYLSRRWISDVFSPYFAPAPIAARPPVPQSQPAAPAEPTAAATAPAAEGQGTPAHPPAAEVPAPPPGTTIRLQLQVTQRCWVSVTGDGNRVLVKLLEPGDAQTFDAVESFYLILGNAGGVRATINGKPAKPFGKDGEVVKVLINQQTLDGLLEAPSG